uniref:Uncharacterized protein n=1 Tax=Cacopsylla melanoneura TaxID=428564 RepID=A0A8D8LYW7_9HEMI
MKIIQLGLPACVGPVYRRLQGRRGRRRRGPGSRRHQNGCRPWPGWDHVTVRDGSQIQGRCPANPGILLAVLNESSVTMATNTKPVYNNHHVPTTTNLPIPTLRYVPRPLVGDLDMLGIKCYPCYVYKQYQVLFTFNIQFVLYFTHFTRNTSIIVCVMITTYRYNVLLHTSL